MHKRASFLGMDAFNMDKLPRTSLAESRELVLRAFCYDLYTFQPTRIYPIYVSILV